MLERMPGRPWTCVAAVTLLAVLALATVGCGKPFDLKAGLLMEDVTTGWFDAGIVEGHKNKLVPSISFRLHDVAQDPVSNVQLNAVFRRTGDDGEWDTTLVKAIDRAGLAPGATTPVITIRGAAGYTGEQPRAQMLQNSAFRDVSVRIFAKQGASQWTLIGEFPLERRLLTQ